jgi:hypothetical protein
MDACQWTWYSQILWHHLSSSMDIVPVSMLLHFSGEVRSFGCQLVFLGLDVCGISLLHELQYRVLDTNHIYQTGTSSRQLLCASSLYCLRQSGWSPCLCHFRPHGFPCCVPPKSRISSCSPQVSCMSGTPDQVSDDKVPSPCLHVTSPAQPSASDLQWHSHN